MFTRQDLPKLYHLDNDNQVNKTKSDDKKVHKSPVSTSKLILTNDETNDSKHLLTEQSNKLLNESENDIDLQTDERMSDLDERSEMDLKNDLKNDSKCDSKKDLKDILKDDSLDLKKDHEQTKKSIQLNIASLKEVINELKANKSRVSKISVEKCFQRKNTNLSKNEITEYINKCLNEDVLEKIKYRDYYGIRLKASFKNGKRSVLNDDEQESIDTNEESDKISLNDKSSINDQDTMSNLDNLSECSSNMNALNEDLDDEIVDNLGYNTKKNALKRCSPTIRYLLRTASEDGISPADMLRSLQSKRILILYDLKKFIWLMKTYFVDRGICEQLTNGNYKYNINNDEENSNTSAMKSQNDESTFNLSDLNSSKITNDEEINLLADEKFSDNENSESSDASSDEPQQQSKEEIINELNTFSKQLTVSKINEIINELVQKNNPINLLEALAISDCKLLGIIELGCFIYRCCQHRLLDVESPLIYNKLMNDIEKERILSQIEPFKIDRKELISSLKVFLKDNPSTIHDIYDGVKNKFQHPINYSLVTFDYIIENIVSKEGFLKKMSDNRYCLLPEINDETSNALVQSASNLDYSEFKMISSLAVENRLKRKIKPKTDKLLTKTLDSALRRPISQRKKIKKSLGPDFLDPSGVKYQLLKSSYENKCEICFKNSDKTMVDCKKCKFKAHRQCLSEIDIMFEKNLKKFECASCRVKCNFCKLEPQELIKNMITCKKCNVSYHIDCLLNKTDAEKHIKNCSTCEKTYFKYLIEKDRPQSNLINPKEINILIDRQEQTDNLNVDMTEESNSSNLKSNIIQEDNPINLEQSKDIEMIEINEETNPKLTNLDTVKEIELNQSNNDEINEDSNVAVSSSTNSSNSNLENSKRIQEDETLVQKYRKLFKAYDVHQQVKISKEQFNTLKSLNSYSNGKSPFDWTVDDVADFITNIGFPEESSAFKKEEIDGQSLLLLKRKDVLTGLSMRLGTALKVYSYIYKLQASV